MVAKSEPNFVANVHADILPVKKPRMASANFANYAAVAMSAENTAFKENTFRLAFQITNVVQTADMIRIPVSMAAHAFSSLDQ